MKFIAKSLIFCLGLSIFAFANDSENLRLEAECENGNIDSCDTIAHYFNIKCLDKKNFDIGQKSIKYYERVCEARKYEACFALAIIYMAHSNCVEQDEQKAVEYAKISCDIERYGQACGFVAERAYCAGNKEEEKEYTKKACEYGDERYCDNQAN